MHRRRHEGANPIATSSSRRSAVQPDGPGEALASELAALLGFSRDALKERWQEIYGHSPPSHLAGALLMRAIAYRIQEPSYGGLDPATRRQLARAARDLAAGREPSNRSAPIKPGTRLLREWHGVLHEAIVLEQSVTYRGQNWPSLSAVAREITGARWSGPRFFGLHRTRRSRDGS